MKLDPREARHVLRQGDFAALATQSIRLPGYPFLSHVPVALDGTGRPLLLLSGLAEHSRNLATDARASLLVSPAGPDPQAQPRLTLLGELQPVEVEGPQRARYLRYHPDAADFLGFGDFRFYRFDVRSIRLVGGFARAGWIDLADWPCPPLSERDEADVLARLEIRRPPGWTLLGLDWEGLDLVTPEGRRRCFWEESVSGLADLERLAAGAITPRGPST